MVSGSLDEDFVTRLVWVWFCCSDVFATLVGGGCFLVALGVVQVCDFAWFVVCYRWLVCWLLVSFGLFVSG